jgi:hypothetical protein
MKRLPNKVKVGKTVRIIYNTMEGFEAESTGNVVEITNLNILVKSIYSGDDLAIEIKRIKAIQII